MDCPSEENLIRMKLEGHSNIEHLEFDIPNRQLTVFHHDNIEGIETAIHDLKLGDTLLSTETIDPSDPNNNFKIDADSSHKKDAEQRKLLWIVLVINFAFFIIEPGSNYENCSTCLLFFNLANKNPSLFCVIEMNKVIIKSKH